MNTDDEIPEDSEEDINYALVRAMEERELLISNSSKQQIKYKLRQNDIEGLRVIIQKGKSLMAFNNYEKVVVKSFDEIKKELLGNKKPSLSESVKSIVDSDEIDEDFALFEEMENNAREEIEDDDQEETGSRIARAFAGK